MPCRISLWTPEIKEPVGDARGPAIRQLECFLERSRHDQPGEKLQGIEEVAPCRPSCAVVPAFGSNHDSNRSGACAGCSGVVVRDNRTISGQLWTRALYDSAWAARFLRSQRV